MARRITSIAPAYRDTGGLRAQDNVDLDVFIGSGDRVEIRQDRVEIRQDRVEIRQDRVEIRQDRVEIRQGTPSPFFSGREAEIQAFDRTLFHFGRGSREKFTNESSLRATTAL